MSSLYDISYVVTNAPGNSTILSRRYGIPFSYLDILLTIINTSEL